MAKLHINEINDELDKELGTVSQTNEIIEKYLEQLSSKIYTDKEISKDVNNAKYYKLYGDYEGDYYNEIYLKIENDKIVDCASISDNKGSEPNDKFIMEQKQIYLGENKDWLLAHLLGEHKDICSVSPRARVVNEEMYVIGHKKECHILGFSESEYNRFVSKIMSVKDQIKVNASKKQIKKDNSINKGNCR